MERELERQKKELEKEREGRRKDKKWMDDIAILEILKGAELEEQQQPAHRILAYILKK